MAPSGKAKQHSTTGTAKKGLGRGLSALIPGADMEFLSRVARGEAEPVPVWAEAADNAESGAKDTYDKEYSAGPGQSVILLGAAAIAPNPYQPRRVFSPAELEELTNSIREHGLLQPILVRRTPESTFQIVAGERRWRAAQVAGLQQIPAVVREVSDQEALELALIENVQRHDISSLDAALAYRRVQEEFSL
jgi:ParB family chromosome partitioning protein